MKNKHKNKITRFLAGFFLAGSLLMGVVFLESFLDSKSSGRVVADEGCPDSGDWINAGDFCIMEDEVAASDDRWEDAAEHCADSEQQSRLCTASEWVSSCELNDAGEISLDNMTDDEEWTADIISITPTQEALTVGDGSCNSYDAARIQNSSEDRTWRCCINVQY